MTLRRPKVAAAALAVLVLTACADTTATDVNDDENDASQERAASGRDGDITQYCPDEPMRVGYAKGSNNTWTRITLAEIEDEAALCENITEVIFTEAQGELQKAVSDLNGLVAQGVAAIVIQPEFGSAQLPSMRAAVSEGAAIVPLISNPEGELGTDYQDFVFQDHEYVGQVWADWAAATIGTGTAVFLGGTPGAASSQQFFDGLSAGLEQYPDLELVEERVVDTDWDTGQKKRVMAGLFAQHGRIDVVFSDYGLTDTGVIDAYLEAGLDPPALATLASGNVNGCQWEEQEFPYLSLDGTTSHGRLALRKALAVAAGMDNDEPSWVNMPVFIDTEDGQDPACEPDLPPDTDLSSELSVDELAELLR